MTHETAVFRLPGCNPAPHLTSCEEVIIQKKYENGVLVSIPTESHVLGTYPIQSAQ